ncbi:Magnesium transport protein CorA [Planococcus massiliensis]|uniref:Magnesium transport protein CorA n=1 Tax=Planococcus massiliensis TaxID=1499687 RepID=A0A098EQP1_9BACL|nr:magnesium transporter CorA family protein [Planococcus massiliensis]MCJ1909558.1 magnesium transporter CorA family protein [Planococcus ruber]CEG24122.1 Magnesium transport protein CorA [Planococcus massiliensis]
MPQYHFKHAIWKEERNITDEEFQQHLPNSHKMRSWIQDSQNLTVNILHMETAVPGSEVIWGSLIYRQNAEKKHDIQAFHFFLSNDFLLTSKLDFESDEDLRKEPLLEQMESAASAVELMMIILGHMVSSILHKIDVFEEQLRNLLWEIREKNDRDTLNKIETLRHRILLWKNLILGFREIKMAIPETFGKEVMEGAEFNRTSMRIDRCQMLINSYKDEINNMVDMENVVANYRGNEIMKTLTVLTTLFTPVMAFGALWGMNFDHMPELKWKYSYLASILLIIGSTLFMYWYLRKRGWTGDILKSLSSKKERTKERIGR